VLLALLGVNRREKEGEKGRTKEPKKKKKYNTVLACYWSELFGVDWGRVGEAAARRQGSWDLRGVRK